MDSWLRASLDCLRLSSRGTQIAKRSSFPSQEKLTSSGLTPSDRHPHHAWERATNENTNGLLRQYLPKQTCLRLLTQAQCNAIAQRLNNRPRLRLGFRTPNEVYYGRPVGDRPWVAACGKRWRSCPRQRPKAYPSAQRDYFRRRNRFTVALQT